VRAVFRWQRARARALGVVGAAPGAVTAVQRFGSALQLNVHFHTLVPDGVFVADGAGARFVPLPAPTDDDVAARAARRIRRLVDGDERDDDDDDHQAAALFTDAARAPVGAWSPAWGPPPRAKRLTACVDDFTLHADTAVAAHDRAGLERLCRYGARPPFAHQRLRSTASGQVAYEKIVYAATNPVKDGLVARVHHWPGVNGLRDLLARRTITVKRPRHFFRDDGDLPEELELTLGLPPELGDADEILATIRRRVAEVEAEAAAERARTGARVLGRRAIRQQSWRDRPRTHEPRFGLRPTVAARNKWARIEALQRNRAFLDAYRDARARWLTGARAIFPPGTYYLRRFAAVPVAAAPVAGTPRGIPIVAT
jgi:hypothetical protein